MYTIHSENNALLIRLEFIVLLNLPIILSSNSFFILPIFLILFPFILNNQAYNYKLHNTHLITLSS